MSEEKSCFHSSDSDDSECLVQVNGKCPYCRTHSNRKKLAPVEYNYLKFGHSPNPIQTIESNHCSCEAHLHPRHWIPPPCRTTKPFSYQSHFPLEMEKVATKKRYTEPRFDKDQIQQLYNEARILKEALSDIRNDERVSKQAEQVVSKWTSSDRRNNEKTECTSSHDRHLEVLQESFSAAVEEEKALRQELGALRHQIASKESLEKENRKMEKKIHQLRGKLRWQAGNVGTSQEMLRVPPLGGGAVGGDNYVVMALKKKYEDVLQYVLKVEAENTRLKTQLGDATLMSPNTDSELNEAGNLVMLLKSHIKRLESELKKRDDRIRDCEKNLVSLQSVQAQSDALQSHLQHHVETSNVRKAKEKHSEDHGGSSEEDWPHRMSQMRQMYEETICGYQQRLEELQRNLTDQKPTTEIGSVVNVDSSLDKACQLLQVILTEIDALGSSGEDTVLAITSLKETLVACLAELKDLHMSHRSAEEERKKENVKSGSLQKILDEKCRQINELEEQTLQLSEKCAYLQTQVERNKGRNSQEELQEMNTLMQQNQTKVSELELKVNELQSSLQIAQGSSVSLKEQLKQVSSQQKISSENAIGEQESTTTKEELQSLRQELSERTKGEKLLQEVLASKDILLERTSCQLEERIRECASLSSQLENGRALAGKASFLQEGTESALLVQLKEAQGHAARYKAQLAVLRSDKDREESVLRHKLRQMEDRVDQLSLNNATLQRQLSTIRTTYDSMFACVGLSSDGSTYVGMAPSGIARLGLDN